MGREGVRVGVDVGGTKMLAVALDDGDAVVAALRRPVPRDGGLVDALRELVCDVAAAADSRPRAVGVGAPGLVDRSGTLVAAPNLPASAGDSVASDLAAATGWTVRADNDATCATLAEWRTGAGAGSSDMVLVTLGTGIGGGLVMDGAVRRGAHGYAGEIGHMTVVRDGEPCACGRRGCWEAYASGSALARLAGVHDATVVTEAAAAGDPRALEVVEVYGDWVALGLAALVNAVDPEVVVLGGGVMAARDVVLGPVRRHFTEHLYGSRARALPRIEATVHGEEAGAIGAGLLAGLG